MVLSINNIELYIMQIQRVFMVTLMGFEHQSLLAISFTDTFARISVYIMQIDMERALSLYCLAQSIFNV